MSKICFFANFLPAIISHYLALILIVNYKIFFWCIHTCSTVYKQVFIVKIFFSIDFLLHLIFVGQANHKNFYPTKIGHNE